MKISSAISGINFTITGRPEAEKIIFYLSFIKTDKNIPCDNFRDANISIFFYLSEDDCDYIISDKKCIKVYFCNDTIELFIHRLFFYTKNGFFEIPELCDCILNNKKTKSVYLLC